MPPGRSGSAAAEQPGDWAIVTEPSGGQVHPTMRFATDAAWYEAAGRPAVVFGPGDVTVAHQPDEHVAIDDLRAVSRALALCGVRLLG